MKFHSRIPYKSNDEGIQIIKWTTNNCPSFVNYYPILIYPEFTPGLDFYFTSEQDVIFFTLKWS
jgi:hypothetical protein